MKNKSPARAVARRMSAGGSGAAVAVGVGKRVGADVFAKGMKPVLQNDRMASCKSLTLEKPSAEAALEIPPLLLARAETLCPEQFGWPGVPAKGGRAVDPISSAKFWFSPPPNVHS